MRHRLAIVLVPLLLGCSPATLAAIGAGASTARDVAKAGCAILEGTDGTSADVLANGSAIKRKLRRGHFPPITLHVHSFARFLAAGA